MIIKNNLNSPQTIITDSGPFVLGANEEAEINGFAPSYDAIYRASGFISVIEREVNTSPEPEGDKPRRGRPRKDAE